MRIERVTLTNFRCFGPDPARIELSPDITAFIGANGSGKTAVLQALSRLFGVTSDQRRVGRQDFHVPQDEDQLLDERTFSVEVLLDFPELQESSGSGSGESDASAVPEFFHQMAVDHHGYLKCRLRFDASWTDDGSVEGDIKSTFQAIRTLEDQYKEADCSNLTSADRRRIQLVYVPSMRDGESQVASFLRGRLWSAISWSDEFRQDVMASGGAINDAFSQQLGVGAVLKSVRDRWDAVLGASVDAHAVPDLRLVDQRFEELVRRIEVVLAPGETGRPVQLREVGDGQRSLFHIAMTLSMIEIEEKIRLEHADGFISDRLPLPALTLLALEEPENNLAPFFLSRIVNEVRALTDDSPHVQSILSSHSASLLGRVSPDNVRHFRLTVPARTSVVREAVRSYPELYFARFVILGEGASEEVVIPRIAEALDLHIDRSFVAIVPLGGRHVNHFWKLLDGLRIPHATLLDLDAGRAGGGWGRIKNTCAHLLKKEGVSVRDLFRDDHEATDVDERLASFNGCTIDESIDDWMSHLRGFGVYFAGRLDLDMLMLESFPEHYRRLLDGRTGPRIGDAAQQQAIPAVLGAEGDAEPFSEDVRALFPWYRYLFVGRSKPDTHLRVLSQVPAVTLGRDAPEVLVALLKSVQRALTADPEEPTTDAG